MSEAARTPRNAVRPPETRRPINLSYHAMQVLRQFLMTEDPLCGAEVTRELKLGAGTVYPMLARLLQEGWLEHAGTLPAPDRPASHFYRITPKGRDAFLARLCRLTIPDHLWRTAATTGGDRCTAS